MEKTRITQKGIGQGAGEKVEVLARVEIEKLIKKENEHCLLRIAEKEQSKLKNGYCIIDLRKGEVGGMALGNREEKQACDNNYIILTKYRNEDTFYKDTVDWDLDWDDINTQLDYKYS